MGICVEFSVVLQKRINAGCFSYGFAWIETDKKTISGEFRFVFLRNIEKVKIAWIWSAAPEGRTSFTHDKHLAIFRATSRIFI